MASCRRRFQIGILASLALIAASATAQTNDDIFGGLQFSFMPPGARALAIGGAFVGRADDATAAYSNPAGLLWLEQPEVSIEIRGSSYSTPYLDGGRLDGEPTGIGIDIFDEPQYSNYDSDTSGVSFLSYAWASREKKLALAVYRHELANFKVDIESQGIFRTLGNTLGQSGAMLGDLDLLIENFGFSSAVPLARNIWLGFGVSYYRIDVEGTTRRFEVESLFEPAQFSPENEFIRRTLDGNDADVAFTGGLLWRSRDSRWSAGAVYRQGPKFNVLTRFEFGPLAETLGRDNPELAAARSGPADFHVPDVFAAGLSYRPIDTLTISFEYDRVRYSNLEPEKNVLTRRDEVGDRLFVEAFAVDDAEEFHLGLEYVFVSLKVPVVLRGGAWTDPDHQMRFTPDRPDDVLGPRYPRGEDIVHYTGGIGVVLMEGRWQLDLAGSTSDRVDILTLSTVVNF